MDKDISKATISELEEEIKRRKISKTKTQLFIDENSPIGYWEVSTEGDCEGRTTEKLGIFYGHIVDIALSLSKSCSYKLTFNKIEIKNVSENSVFGNSVNIALDVRSGTWDLNKENRPEVINSFLNKEKSLNGYKVVKCDYYAAVTLKKIDK